MTLASTMDAKTVNRLAYGIPMFIAAMAAVWFGAWFTLTFVAIALAVVVWEHKTLFGRANSGDVRHMVILLTIITAVGLGRLVYLGFTDRPRLLLVFLLIVATDVGAYFGGRLFKRRLTKRQFSRYSPNKTWEGALSGYGLALVVGALLMWFTNTTTLAFLLLVLLVPLGAIYGDLFESAIKRKTHVKDASNVAGEMGGLSDRADSMTGGALIELLVAGVFAMLATVF